MPQPTRTTTASLTNPRHRARLRLAAQGLTVQRWATAADAARAFGVMQGQDFASVRRSLALRAADDSDWPDLVRGYPMRSTLFIAAREDMGWITQLCVKPRKGDPGLDDVAAQLGEGCTRAELKDLAARLHPDLTFWHVVRILMETGRAFYTGPDQLVTPLALDGLEARFNGDREAAATELAARYFRTHGPATLRDFAWWSKLPVALIKRAAARLPEQAPDLVQVGEDFLAAELLEYAPAKSTVHLLGGFDEYILGYQDRLFAMSSDTHEILVPGNRGVFRRAVVVDGMVRGMWSKRGIEDLGLPAYARSQAQSQLQETYAIL